MVFTGGSLRGVTVGSPWAGRSAGVFREHLSLPLVGDWGVELRGQVVRDGGGEQDIFTIGFRTLVQDFNRCPGHLGVSVSWPSSETHNSNIHVLW